jgi:hypothetical protein
MGGGLRADYPLKSATETSQQFPYTLLLGAHRTAGRTPKDLTFRIQGLNRILPVDKPISGSYFQGIKS